jgi:hypothetical protein
MLVAYGPDGHPVIAEEQQIAQLLQWSRERQLYCPNCRGILHIRGGPEKRTHLHFAHQRGECGWGTEPESVRHAQGKRVLAYWLQEQFPQATITLEERLAEPNRIADVFVVHPDGRRWAIEFQCAPLDIGEWKRRRTAYQQAQIRDLWIIGVNRREKQEAFSEAILSTDHEMLFLDPQVTPARIWLRWLIERETAQEWQQIVLHRLHAPMLDGLAGRAGTGAILQGQLHEVTLDEWAHLHHPTRTALETRAHLLHTMQTSSILDEVLLSTYLRPIIQEEALHHVIRPLIRAYLRDPELLRRYNYGRGLLNQPLSEVDQARIRQAQHWLASLARHGFTRAVIREILQVIPYVGPYAAFARYVEMLLSLSP